MDKTTKYITTTKQQENFTRQYRATIHRAIPVEKHNHPYQIKKIEVPQHQPYYKNGFHSRISGDHQRNVKEEFLNILMFRHNLLITHFINNLKIFLESLN